MKIKLFIYLLISSVSGVFAQNINVALGKPTTADSVHSDAYPSSKAVDGNKLELVDRWVSVSSIWPHWIEVDLEGNYEIEQLKFWTGYNGYNSPVQYEFQIWDGSSWLTVVDGGSNSSPIVDESFTKVTTSRVRLYANSGQGNYFRLYEIEVYGTEVGGNDGGGNTTTPTNTENSVWEAVNSDINYTAGKVGIGMVPAADGDYVLGVGGTVEIKGDLNLIEGEGQNVTIDVDDVKITGDESLSISGERGISIESQSRVTIGTADTVSITGDQNVSINGLEGIDLNVTEAGDIKMNTEDGSIILNSGAKDITVNAEDINLASIYNTNINSTKLVSISGDEGVSIVGGDDQGLSLSTGNDLKINGENTSVFSSNDLQLRSSEHIIMSCNAVNINSTASSEYMFSVGGKGVIEELKIALQGTDAWPDYVFENNYQLPSLKEVEKHINKKGHLANIPSAKEVKKEGGIHLGEMNVKLLQKIEELTLYTIAQEKAIKAQTEKNAALEARLAKLEALLIK